MARLGPTNAFVSANIPLPDFGTGGPLDNASSETDRAPDSIRHIVHYLAVATTSQTDGSALAPCHNRPMHAPQLIFVFLVMLAIAISLTVWLVRRKQFTRFCPKCGRGLKLPKDATCCSFCGERLP